jgi:hypothetical protein
MLQDSRLSLLLSHANKVASSPKIVGLDIFTIGQCSTVAKFIVRQMFISKSVLLYETAIIQKSILLINHFSFD